MGRATVGPGETASLHVAYRSQGLDSWRYQLGDGVAQARDFMLTMQTNFRDIDFADDTLSPTSKQLIPGGWQLTWQYSNLVSGFQIGMTMPQKLQPGPLAGEISYAAPVSLFFFFFLMFIITTLRKIDLHPMNYFFLATAFFAFHLLLAYLVDHISIHAAMVLASVVSVALGRELPAVGGWTAVRRAGSGHSAADLSGAVFLRFLLEGIHRAGYHDHRHHYIVCGDAGYREDSVVRAICGAEWCAGA